MYRHLLVPVDATDLSTEVVASAVDFAASAGARVTFLHASPQRDASRPGAAEALPLVWPDDFLQDRYGRACELLAKAEAAARAWGVPSDAIHVVSDKPASAIVAAARNKGCDLIFLASQGSSKPGTGLSSDTTHVLMHAGLPVLVAATGVQQPPARAIAVIRDEHRALAAVLHAWMHSLAAAGAAGDAPAAGSMRTMLRCIERFKLERHHAKEEHLFQRLRERTPSIDAELDELGRQHERDRLLVAGLAEHVEALEAATGDEGRRRAACRSLEQAVSGYASFIWDHLGREEAVVLPAARRFLTDADWTAIDAAYSEHGAHGADGDADPETRDMFSRILDFAR